LGAALTREQAPSPRLESTVFWISVAVSGALMLLLCAAAAPLGFAFRDPSLGPVLAALSAILVLCGMLAVPNARIARGQRFLVFAGAEVVATLVSAAAAIASALAGLGAWSLVIQQLTLWSIKAVWVFGASGFRPALVCDL